MPSASLHLTLGIWPSRTGKSCTKWCWCSWQNKLQWLLNHMNYLSLWLVSHRLQTNVLLWLPLRYSDKNHLGGLKGQWHRVFGASTTSQGPAPSGSSLPRGCLPWLHVPPAARGGQWSVVLGQVRGRIVLKYNHKCANGCNSRQPQLLIGLNREKVSWLKEKLDLLRQSHMFLKHC